MNSDPSAIAATAATLARFGQLEDGHRYTELLELFTDETVYYDPFFGPQVGLDALGEFMSHMEEMVPKSGATFTEWTVAAGSDCGWATWFMEATRADGARIAVPGESLYRLSQGKVIGVVDYVDPIAYSRLRPGGERRPDLTSSASVLPRSNEPAGPAADALRAHVDSMERAGRWPGRAELIDCAGDIEVGWAQWMFHGEHGSFPGWTLRDGDGRQRDLFDTVRATELST